MKVLTRAAVLAAWALLPGLSSARGQSVLVQVTESESGRPIPGAFVSLLDDQGRVLRSALTDDSGRFLFPVQAAGAFRVRGEMIGRETRSSEPLTLRGGESGRIVLSLPAHAIPLEEIRVEADERCRLRPDEASHISRVWEEARKALAIQAWTEQTGLYRMVITTYERDLDRTGRKVEREDRKGSTAVTRTPFRSLPADDLLTKGFVQSAESGGHDYFGPDAAVLLSDLFLDTHCFRLERSADLPGSLGLSFEPLEGRDLPDIRGTLWLDLETAELQFLEYRYTRVPYWEGEGIGGGRVEFQAMPDGAWIIDRWWIRAPILAQYVGRGRAGGPEIRVEGIRETGGEVTRTSTLNRQRVSEVNQGSLRGTVWDSTVSAPLEGATVYLSGTSYRAVTDVNGRFRIRAVPDGVFTAAFTHPRLDSLGILGLSAEVEIRRGEDSEVRLSIPSYGTIWLAACRAEDLEGGAAVLSGVVRDLSSGEPIPGAVVRVAWQEVEAVMPVFQARDRWLEARSDAEGRYVACGIPLGELIEVRASFQDLESRAFELRFLEEGHQVQDFDIELPSGLLSTQAKNETPREGMGAQGIQGILTDPESGDPIRNAEVTIRARRGRVSVTATGVTDVRGFFRLQTPESGRYFFSANALGYADVRDEMVEVSEGKLTVVEIQMAPEALELEPLVVSAERRDFHLELEGFYDRQAGGLNRGLFLTPEVLEARRPRWVTDLLVGLPGTRVINLTGGRRALYFRDGVQLNGRICWPRVYVDRSLVSAGGFSGAGADSTALDAAVAGVEVSAIEVYPSAARVPPEFNGLNASCGVVVIWTKRGGAR